MVTNSDRNLSFEQAQAMWPGVTLDPNEKLSFNVTMLPNTNDGGGAVDDPRFTVPVGIGPAVLDNHFDKMAPQPIDTASIPQETLDKIKKQFAGKMATEAVKADNGKPDWSLVPFEALEGMVRVLEFGANKYQAYNFAKGNGLDYTRLISATIRHMSAFARGEDIDPESGLSHIHHCQCNLLFISYFIAHKEKYTKNDDRYKI